MKKMKTIDDLINALIKKEKECLRAYESDNDIKYYGSYIGLGYASALADELKTNMEKANERLNDFSDLIWYLEKAIEKIEKADSLVISSLEEKEQFQAALSAYEDALEQVEKLKTNMEQQ